MTLQRRLLLPLLIGVPLTWLVAFGYSVQQARKEINELFDTQQVRLAQQVASFLPAAQIAPLPLESARYEERGAADLPDLSVNVWRSDGTRLLFDREGFELPLEPNARGFVDATVNGEDWRTYYLRTADGKHIVGVGQELKERHELLRDVLVSQLRPWVLMLPLLLLFIALSVRQALRPVRALVHDLEMRTPDDLRPLGTSGLPDDLQPLLAALNELFDRIRVTLDNERRLTADAAHELRTPLAALRAQWEASNVATNDDGRARALDKVGIGIERLSHLVAQLLALAGAESTQTTAMTQDVAWPSVVGNALSDCLPMIEARGIEVEVHWPDDRPDGTSTAPLPLRGDEALLTTLVRNLVDNALRYTPAGSHVHVYFERARIVVEDEGPGVAPAQLASLGDRFRRGADQRETGSGLGLSIVRRIAALHGLDVTFANRSDGQNGLRVELRRHDAVVVSETTVRAAFADTASSAPAIG